MPMLGSRAAAALKNWGFTRILSTVLARLTDQYYKYTTLLIRAKNGSPEVNTTTATAAVGFNSDSSATLAQLNLAGDVKPTSRSPYTVGFYSNYFNASTDFITAGAAYPGSTVTSFTIECWIYMTANPVSGSGIPGLVGDMNTSGTTNYSSFGPIAARTLTLYWFPGATTYCNGSTVMNLFRWYHIAVSVNANAIKMFVDGVADTLSGTTTLTNRSGTTSGTTIGTYSTSYFLGYISNLRIISGYGLYNANFTPSTAPLNILPGTTLLTCNSFTLEDRGPIRYALTKGGNTTVNAAHPFTPTYAATLANTDNYSMFFNGSTDYMTVSPNTAFDFGTGDFTIEFWIYLTNGGSRIITNRATAAGAGGTWSVGVTPTSISMTEVVVGEPGITATINNIGGTWAHIAVTRASSTSRIFLNGVLSTSATITTNFTNSSYNLWIGTSPTENWMQGFLSNLRIIKGTALYTSSFTPSTTPLTAVSGTVLLTCQGIVPRDNSSNNFSLGLGGSVQVSKFHPFLSPYTTPLLPATYSTYFDGTGDYLYVPPNPSFGFSGDFSVEAWVYQMSRNTNAQIAGPHLYGVSADWLWVINASGNLLLQLTSSGTGALTSTGVVPLSTWTHVVVARISGTVTFYINGLSSGGGSYATSVTNTSTALAIGASTNINAASTFTGYISNLRIVKGKSAYTGNFVPSTSPLGVTQVAGTNIAALTNTIPANGYSVWFDGSGDTLVLPYDASYAAFGTSNFTIEAWVYMVSFGNGFPVYLTWDGGVTARFSLGFSSTGPGSDTAFGLALSPTTIVSVTPSLNTWYHIAVVRNGSTFTWYQNGVATSTATSASAFSPTGQPVYVGDYPNDYSTGAGYVSNLRVVNGVAVYTGNFTPSTTPLTAIVGTTLLLCQGPDFADRSGQKVRIQRNNDAGSVGLSPFGTSDTVLLTCQGPTITDAAGGHTVTAAGDAKPVSTFSPLQPATGYDTTFLSSAYFDGSGDYIDVAAGSWQPMGNADFTIELWVYPTAAPTTSWNPFLTMGFSGGAQEIRISQNINATGYGFLVPSNTAATDSYAGYGTMALNQWHHLALVRTGTTVTLYRNGVAAGSLTGLNFNHTANSLFRIGGSQAAYPDGVYTGYMADLRVVRGLALYRTTFTPPLTPLSATVANPGVTNLLTLQQPGTLYNNFFADTGVDNAVVTRNGSAHAGTFTPFGPGWSMYFDGSSSYVNLQSSAAFAIATSTTPFTIECWIYPLATTGVIISEAYTGSGSIGITFHFNDASGSINTDGPYLMLAYYTGSTWVLAGRSSVAPTLKVWQHVAAVFTGSTTKIFFDGVDVTSSTTPVPITTWPNTGINGDAWYIGRRWDTFANVYFNGYMSNFRFTNGAAVYTAAFTPPTAALTPTAYTTLLTLQDSWLQDRSRYNAQINTVGTPRMSRFNPFGNYAQTPNGYSTFFDGTGDYFTVPYNAVFDLSTSTWTLETWFYATTFASVMHLFSKDTYGVNFDWSIGILNATTIICYTAGTASNLTATVPAMATNTWHHVAYVRNSGTLTIYLNGVSYASSALSITNASATTPTIGCAGYNSPNSFFNGYLSDLRLVKGVALYTGSTYTVPTATLTAVPGTVLLTCQNNRFVDNSTNNFSIVTYGDVRVTEFSRFGYTTALADTSVTAAGSSMFFNGSTSYLTVPASSTFSIPTNTTPFTIDCWVYVTSTSSLSSILSEAFTGGSNTINLYVGLNSGTDLATVGMYPALAYYTGTAWGRAATTTLPIGAGAWYHLAFVFTGSTTKIYVNGRDWTAAGAASTWGGTLSSNGDGPWYIGRRWDTSAPAYFNGYISNFRFVKGVALYSSPFVPARTLQRAPGETLAISSYTTGIVDGTGQNTIETVGDVKINQRTGGPYGTYNSVYFNGSSSLSMALPALAGSNFTLEAWIYLTAYSASYSGAYALCMLGTGNGTNGFEWTISGSTNSVINFYSKSGGAGGGTLAGNYAFQLNTWYHVATTVSGSTMTHYVNGANIASGTITGWTDVGTAYIGYLPASGYNYWFNGYINNLRVVKGTAVYTSNFTPTIGDLPAVSNTVLLTCRGTRFIDSSPTPLTITLNSLPQVTEFNPFTPNVSNSIYFDGTGDYLVLPFNERLHILQEDFTVECWFNSLSAAANQVLIGQWLQTSGQGGYSLFVDTNRVGFSFGPANEGAALILPATTYVLGTWNHAAVVRSGNTFTIYLNGVSTGTATSSATRAVLSVNTVLGNYYAAAGTVPASGANYYYGYLADVRMSKYARYTATFTPPTAELPATA